MEPIGIGGLVPAYRPAISRAVHDAVIGRFDVFDDRFQVIGEHAPGFAIVHARSYLGIEYSG